MNRLVGHDPQFIDTFTRIDMINGVVRVELGVLQPGGEGRQPEVLPSGVLVMPVDGFVRSAATMQAFLRQLAEKGVVRREPANTVGGDQAKPAGKASS